MHIGTISKDSLSIGYAESYASRKLKTSYLYLKHFLRYNNVCLILNDGPGSELCTDKDYGFEGDDGVDLITWTLPTERVSKGTGIFSYI